MFDFLYFYHKMQFYACVHCQALCLSVGKWWLKDCNVCAWIACPYQKLACGRITILSVYLRIAVKCFTRGHSCGHLSTLLGTNWKSLSQIISCCDVYVTGFAFNFDIGVTASELKACTLFASCYSSYNWLHLMIPRYIHNDPQISGTLPTQLGQLSALQQL